MGWTWENEIAEIHCLYCDCSSAGVSTFERLLAEAGQSMVVSYTGVLDNAVYLH